MYEEDLALNNLQWLICHKTKQNLVFMYLIFMEGKILQFWLLECCLSKLQKNAIFFNTFSFLYPLQQMHEVLIQELNRQIYIRSTVSKNVQRTGSGRCPKKDPLTGSPADRAYKRSTGVSSKYIVYRYLREKE